MALHDDLLTLARNLVDRNPGAQIDAELRWAVSTANYTLFHLLVHESTTRLVAIEALRPRVARSFDYGIMKRVCAEYASLKLSDTGEYTTSTGQVVPRQLRELASWLANVAED
jgi:hypothetical protein